MSIQSEEGLKQAYKMLSQGELEQANEILASVLVYNLENKEINFATFCCSFWIDFIKTLSKSSFYEQGESLLYHWKIFEEAYEAYGKKREIFERTVFSVQTGIFTLALKNFSAVRQETLRFPSQKADLLLKIGICNKKLGNYDIARQYLMEANKNEQGSAQIIAEMADCCALCGMETEAKVLFREAFYIDAKKIDLSLLDCELIKCLIQNVKENPLYNGSELAFWVPVFAVLYGVFNIKHELRSVEVLKLKQDIYEIENEIKNPANNVNQLKPKLIYMYFRLIDHYIQKNQTGNEVSDILLKIRILDKNIYDLYIK